MAQVDPLWKFCQLLDRLVMNERRIIECITLLARDYSAYYAQAFVDHLQARFYNLNQPDRMLYYLYVIDSLTYNVYIYREKFDHCVERMFTEAYRASDQSIQRDMEKLLTIWEDQQRFSRHTLDLMRERMAPTPPMVISPTDSPVPGLFDLGEQVSEWLSNHSQCPSDLLMQGVEDNYSLLFTQLLQAEVSKWEKERLNQKINYAAESQLLSELYEDLPRQCFTCGLRFSLDSELDAHLDWHYESNSKRIQGVIDNPWLPTPQEWIEGTQERKKQQVSEQVEKPEVWTVCDPDQLFCAICGQQFDAEPRKGSWLCKDAARVYVEDQGVDIVLHLDCVKETPLDEMSMPPPIKSFEDSFI